MPLFTDGPPSSIEDLSAQDAQLTDVANVEGIDVTRKLAMAWDELGLELYSMLTSFGTADRMFWQPPRPNLGAVVVTPPLKLWHTFRALQMVYEDAYNCQLNDRYAGKRDRFGERARWAIGKLKEIGIGICGLPVARASLPVVSPAAALGLPLPDGAYFAAAAWINRNGEEGAVGDAADVTTSGGTFLVNAGTAPSNAVSWNVYAGPDENALSLQNSVPLPAGQTWLQPAPMVAGGRAPGDGQAASYLTVVPQLIQRG